MRRDIKIDEIRALVALVDGGTLVKAAAVVGRTESALSLQLKRLEESAGVALLEKQGRRLVLTEAGRVVLEHGRRMIAAQEELRDLAGQRKTPIRSETAGEAFGHKQHAYPIHGMVSDAPMCVTLSADGQFREMRPIQSFRQSLEGSLPRAAYDYWIARSQLGEMVDFEALATIAGLSGAHYAIAIVRVGPVQDPEVEVLTCDLPGSEGSAEDEPRGVAQGCAKVRSLLRHVHRIEMPIAWSGACIVASHRLHGAHSLALPLCSANGTCDAVAVISEVSLTERYLIPVTAPISILSPERVQISTDDHIAPPAYLAKSGQFRSTGTKRNGMGQERCNDVELAA